VFVNYENYHLGKFLKYYPEASIVDDLPLSAESITVEPLILGKNGDDKKIVAALLDLRERIFAKLPEPKKKQILIVQRQRNRIFTNLDRIVTACEKYLPTVVFDFETLPFPEQVEQVLNARIVIAAHGSALSHIAFSKGDTIFIEVRPRFFTTECFTKLSLLFDREIHTIFSELDPSDQHKDLSLLFPEDIERLQEKDPAIRKKIRDIKFVDPDISALDALLRINF
jgi:hypothetical protein